MTRQVVADVLDPGTGRLTPSLDVVPRVREDDDLPCPDEELARVPRDLLLAVGEDEPGQVAAVLAPDPEVRVDADAVEPGAEPFEAGGPGRRVGLRPAGEVVGRRRWREIGR